MNDFYDIRGVKMLKRFFSTISTTHINEWYDYFDGGLDGWPLGWTCDFVRYASSYELSTALLDEIEKRGLLR